MQTPSNTVSNSNKGADGALGANTSTISQEFHNFIADVEDLVKATTNLSGDELHKAKAKMQQRIVTAKESMGEMSSNIATRTRRAAQQTNNYVHEQPWNAIGADSVIGLLLGYVLARRS